MPGSLPAIDEHKRHEDYDKTADIAFSKEDMEARKAAEAERMRSAGTVSNFGGLVSSKEQGATTSQKEQAYMAQTTTGKVTDFSGLKQSTRKIVTADAEEQKRIERARVVQKQKSMFSNLNKRESMAKKPSVQLDQSMKDAAKDAKNVFRAMEKQTTMDNLHKKRGKSVHKKGKGKGKKRKSTSQGTGAAI